MKLIMQYGSGDGYTWSILNHLPIEYDSEESLLIDFEKTLDQAFLSQEYYFYFLNREFKLADFFDEDNIKMLPNIYTLDSWFETYKII